ncbi:MAG TPA: hypothetical protein VKT78_02840 [Fimbriimonadaceae bacterium]|nr:hypothetical protein [Fimbriimonadaceae bacterium]
MPSLHRVRFLVVAAAAGLVCLVTASLTSNLSLTVNGAASAKPPIMQSGEVYVPISALKAAGAQVARSGNHISVAFSAASSGPAPAVVEGKLNEWLTNGIWRLRVQEVKAGEGGCEATVEIGNVSSVTTYPAITGVSATALFNDKNEKAAMSGASDDAWSEMTAFDIAPGATVVKTLKFSAKSGFTPNRLILVVAPDSDKREVMKRKGLKFSGGPSFRVMLG